MDVHQAGKFAVDLDDTKTCYGGALFKRLKHVAEDLT